MQCGHSGSHSGRKGGAIAESASDPHASELELEHKPTSLSMSPAPPALRQISAKRDDTAIAEVGIKASAASMDERGRKDFAMMDEKAIHSVEGKSSMVVISE